METKSVSEFKVHSTAVSAPAEAENLVGMSASDPGCVENGRASRSYCAPPSEQWIELCSALGLGPSARKYRSRRPPLPVGRTWRLETLTVNCPERTVRIRCPGYRQTLLQQLGEMSDRY